MRSGVVSVREPADEVRALVERATDAAERVVLDGAVPAPA